MANIKISELNALTERADNDLLAIVDTSADETKKIQVSELINKNIELIAVSDTAPSECSIGDKYYNTTDKEIYTATAMNTWSETGTTPISGIFYIVFDEQSSYSWDGTDLVSVGGGKEDIVIDDEEPTDPDVKLWINTGEVENLGSEVHIGDTIDSKVGLNILMSNNLLKLESSRSDATYNNDGSITITTSSTISFTQKLDGKLSSGTYTFKNYTNAICYVMFSSSDYTHSIVQNGTYTFNYDGSSYLRLVYENQVGGTRTYKASINKGSLALDYEPYITPTINVYGEDIYSKSQVLWTNPSPTNDFANQSITLSEDASNYKYLEIYWKNRKDIKEWTYTKMMTGTIGYGFMISASGTSFRAFSRQASNVTTTSIAFSVCNYVESLSSALTTANNYMIPYQIIGYKE